MVASAAARKPAGQPQTNQAQPLLAGLMGKMLSVFSAGDTAPAPASHIADAPPRPAMKLIQSPVLVADIPLPPQRPAEFLQTANAAEAPLPASDQDASEVDGPAAAGPALAETVDAAPLPPHRPGNAALVAVRRLARIALPKLITGSQRILPPDFSAYADSDR